LKLTQQPDCESPWSLLEPYLDWRLVALEPGGILICRGGQSTNNTETRDLLIIEGELMSHWLKHRYEQ
jgi:hypothetical protein